MAHYVGEHNVLGGSEGGVNLMKTVIETPKPFQMMNLNQLYRYRDFWGGGVVPISWFCIRTHTQDGKGSSLANPPSLLPC